MLTRSSLAVPLGDEIMIPMCRKRSRQPSTSPPGPSEPRRSAQAAGDANRPRSRAGPRVGPPRVRSGATARCGGTPWRLSPWSVAGGGSWRRRAGCGQPPRFTDGEAWGRGQGERGPAKQVPSEGPRPQPRRPRRRELAPGAVGTQTQAGGPLSPTALSSPSVPVPAKIPPRPGKARGHRRTVESHPLVPSPTPPRSLHRAGGDGGGRGPQGKGTRTRRAEEGRRWRGAGGGPFSKTVSALLATRAAFWSRLSWACPQSVWGGRFRLCSRRCHE